MMTSNVSPRLQNQLNLGQNILRGSDVADCEQLYCLLGLLILEGRLPSPSDLGRSSGPHAHYAFSSSSLKSHICDLKDDCCLLAHHYRHQLSEFARRTQAICIKVWLLPECGHYDNFMRSAYDNLSTDRGLQLDCPMQDSFLLIEEWNIQLISKRNFSGPIQTVTSLLRTIASYLHSSELSNSLLETKGTSPKNVYYKISNLQHEFYPREEIQRHIYKDRSFPNIAAGESNILNISVRTMTGWNWNKNIKCDICAFESSISINELEEDNRQIEKISRNNPQFSRLKMSTSSSASSVSWPSKREKTLSESQDKRRGFTLPLNSTKFKQQIISPMVVYTDDSEKPPETLFLRNKCLTYFRQPTKDVTPYPKYKTINDMATSFIEATLENNNKQLESSTPVNKPRHKTESRIILTDSSSSESLDRSNNQFILPLATETVDSKLALGYTTKEFYDKHQFSQPVKFNNSNCQNSGSNFNPKNGLPLQSSPAPNKKILPYNMSTSVEIKRNKSKISTSRLAVTPGVEYEKNKSPSMDSSNDKNLSSSAPVVSSQKLLVNFEESLLNLRIHPLGMIDGFEVELGASGSFNPKHFRLPLTTYFFQLSDDNAPSPYLGFVDLLTLNNKRGYQVPKKGSIQLTLFNPNGAVIKMFVVLYNLSDMPANHQTFLRQRTIYMPVHQKSKTDICLKNRDQYWSNWTVGGNSSCESSTSQSQIDLPSYLRYLVHLKLHTAKSGKLYLHTDIRLIFSRDKFEFDPTVATYELRSFVDPPPEPRYSPKN